MRAATPLVVTALLLAGCGSDDPAPAEAPTTPAGQETNAGGAPTQPTTPDDGPPPAPASTESCGEPATIINVGDSIDGEMLPGDPFTESIYYCVEVPPGHESIVFTLTNLTDDLDLWVGFDTFDDLGGGVNLSFSDNNGTDDESITREPSLYRGELIGFDQYADVTPGPYWIEILGDPSTYTLTVTGT